MTPRVGDVVHYFSDGTQAFTSECRAAIVTEVGEQTGFGELIGLCELSPTGFFFHRGIEQDERECPSGGSWHRCSSPHVHPEVCFD